MKLFQPVIFRQRQLHCGNFFGQLLHQRILFLLIFQLCLALLQEGFGGCFFRFLFRKLGFGLLVGFAQAHAGYHFFQLIFYRPEAFFQIFLSIFILFQ